MANNTPSKNEGFSPNAETSANRQGGFIPPVRLTKQEKKRISARIKEINGIYNEKSTQNAIPYSNITRDGICVIPKSYFGKTQKLDFFSVTLRFSDINYQLTSDETQNAIFTVYSDILNYFEDSVRFQLTMESRKRDTEMLVKRITIEPQDDDFNPIRKEYSDIIKNKLLDSDNGNELIKFLTFGIFAKDISEARPKLGGIATEIINIFKKAQVEAARISGKERLAVFYRALNPYRRNKFLFDWDFCQKFGANTKDFISPTSMIFDKKSFELGDCYGSVMSVSLIASELKDRILYDFLNLNQLICVNIHVKPFDIHTGLKMTKDTLLNVKALRSDRLKKNGGDLLGIPEEMTESIEELTELLRDLKSKSEKLFQITLTIRTYAHTKSQMKLQCDTLRRICQSNSCNLISIDYQQEDGLCASLPLGVTKVHTNRILHTSSLAVFMPFTSSEIFQIKSKNFSYYGINALTGNLILADKLDKSLPNPNSIILGMPGSGKSFAVKREILDLFLRTLNDIFICDPEGEYFPLVEALHGQVVRLSATSGNYINPMDIIFDKRLLENDEDPIDPIPDKIDFLLSFMELIVGGTGLTATERSLIDRAAKKLYEDFLKNAPSYDENEYENAKVYEAALENYGENNMPILENLYVSLSQYGEVTERVYTSLEMYVYGSQKFFNHRSNIDVQNRIICFDIKNLGESLKKLGMLIIQGTVWDTVTKNRQLKKTTRFYIDEFHLLLKNEQTAKYCVEFWKRFRKWGGIPTGITQNVQDLLRSNSSEHIDTIFSNTMFFYLLNQATEDREILMDKLKISPQEAEFITNAPQGSGLIKFAGTILPFNDQYPDDTMSYRYLTTKPSEAVVA